MNYPVWDLGFGLPLLIALVAIPHVMVAHFAIGGGLFLAVYERAARRSNDSEMLAYVRSHSRLFTLLTLVFGAMTGVGIWFTIGLISPAATSALIHTFVWFWATEWVMFFVEITAALVYYYSWDRIDPKTHEKVMWVYFAAAWGSLVVINGIITFMLTSGTWPTDRSIWPAFFNATYLPSLVFRTLITFLMAGIFAFLSASWQSNDSLRKRINRVAALWTLPSMIFLVPVTWWYFKSLPPSVLSAISGNWLALQAAQERIVSGAIALAAVIVLTIFIKNRTLARALALVMVLLGLQVFGAFEWVREAARKPYVIAGYMYSNGLLASDTTTVRQAGLLPTIKWQRPDPVHQGEDLFRAACQSCHSLDGYNGIARMVAERGWTAERLGELVPRTSFMRGAMPPFVGTAEEGRLIAGYVHKKAKDLNMAPLPKTPEQIWSANCGLCHTLDGHRPLRQALSGMSVPDLKDAILTANELSDAMPPFAGSEQDAESLAGYLSTQLTKPTNGGVQ